jgi:hypothetical protein
MMVTKGMCVFYHDVCIFRAIVHFFNFKEKQKFSVRVLKKIYLL